MKRRRNLHENNNEEDNEIEINENEDEIQNLQQENSFLFLTKKWFVDWFKTDEILTESDLFDDQSDNLSNNKTIKKIMRVRKNNHETTITLEKEDEEEKEEEEEEKKDDDDDNDNDDDNRNVINLNNTHNNNNNNNNSNINFNSNIIKYSDNITSPILQRLSQTQLSPTVSSVTPSNVPFQSLSSSSSSSFLLYNHISSYVQSTISYYRLKYLEGDNDLYYTLRTQPFSSGIYLRGMLISGFNNTLFHLYDLFILLFSTNIYSYYEVIIYRILVILLFFHILFNFLCVPTRILLHYKCWNNSRVIDSESASVAIQELIHSNVWILNRILAWIIDIISLSTLLFGQLFLWFDDHSSPFITTLILNICSTDILSFLIRLLIVAIYLLSFREFRDNSGIRNRGMSNFDLDRMITFQFTKENENKYNDCSICLQPYEINEILTTLPCHERHCFHASCVKEWLKRQNACPLCQKIC